MTSMKLNGNRILKVVTMVLMSMAMVLSCTKGKMPIAMGLNTIGSIKGDIFADDRGMTHVISESVCGYEDMERAYAEFDLLEKVAEGKYSIRLRYVHAPLCKDPLRKSATDDSELGNDPVKIADGWISGGYINLKLDFCFRQGSETKHFINLVYDDTMPKDTIRLSLRHNGYGEGRMYPGDASLSVGQSIACFRTEGLLPEGKDEIPVVISGSWYETVTTEDGVMMTGGLTEFKNKGVLKR